MGPSIIPQDIKDQMGWVTAIYNILGIMDWTGQVSQEL